MKLKNILKRVDIAQKKISRKHNDSFWYDGFIASCGEKRLYAMGEIRLVHNDSYHNGNKAFDSFDIPLENDHDLSKVEELGGEWLMNNWFEIFDDSEEAFGSNEVCGTYDEGITALKD